jgi:hypothetical protein
MNKLDWLKLITINKVKKTRIEHYGLPLPKFTQYLRTWGEAGIIKTPLRRKNQRLGSHRYVRGLCFNSPGRLLQNVKS